MLPCLRPDWSASRGANRRFKALILAGEGYRIFAGFPKESPITGGVHR